MVEAFAQSPRKYTVCGLGAALVDIEVEISDQLLQDHSLFESKGEMRLVDEEQQLKLIESLQDQFKNGHCKQASGGSAANTTVTCAFFGAKTYYCCKVADDVFGDFYLQDLDRAGVIVKPRTAETNRIEPESETEPSKGHTGKCLALITPDAERTMLTFLGVSERLSVCDIEVSADAIKSSEYLYVEGYLVSRDCSRHAAIKARLIAEENGVKTCFSLSDPNMVKFFSNGIREMLGNGVDLLFCNEEEAKEFAKVEALQDALISLERIAKAFVVTLGCKGALAFDGLQYHNIDPVRVKAVDTNGAGDAFAGAFLYGLSEGYGFDKAGRLAAYTSAQVVSQLGPRLNPDQYMAALKHSV